MKIRRYFVYFFLSILAEVFVDDAAIFFEFLNPKSSLVHDPEKCALKNCSRPRASTRSEARSDLQNKIFNQSCLLVT